MKHLRLMLAGACLIAGCGTGGSSSPANTMTGPTTAIDVSGFWSEVPSGHATLTLRQIGDSVTGTADLAVDNIPAFGVYSGAGETSGILSGDTLRLTSRLQLTNSAGPIAGCIETVTDTLTVTIRPTDSSMVGSFVQVDTCGDTVVFTRMGRSNFTRR